MVTTKHACIVCTSMWVECQIDKPTNIIRVAVVFICTAYLINIANDGLSYLIHYHYIRI